MTYCCLQDTSTHLTTEGVLFQFVNSRLQLSCGPHGHKSFVGVLCNCTTATPLPPCLKPSPQQMDDHEQQITLTDDHELRINLTDNHELQINLTDDHELPINWTDDHELQIILTGNHELPMNLTDNHELRINLTDDHELRINLTSKKLHPANMFLLNTSVNTCDLVMKRENILRSFRAAGDHELRMNLTDHHELHIENN